MQTLFRFTFHKVILFLFVFVSALPLLAQNLADSVLSFDSYLAIVEKQHPLAYQAQLQLAKAKATKLKAKGNFDPKLSGDINQKYFKDDAYYDLVSGSLEVPTWFGVSFEGGYDNSQGTRLNPQNYTPDAGLWFAGIKVPLGKGLIIDKRRAEWRQAKVFAKSSIQEQRIMMNDLILNASNAYWKWFKSYNKMLVYQQGIDNALIRLNGVRENVIQGDKPAIDTLEATIQLQNRKISWQDAFLDYQNSTELMEIFLWREGYFPLELSQNTAPPAFEENLALEADISLFSQMDSLKYSHPEILKSQLKIESKEIKQKLYRENLKPKVDLKYNALSEPVNGNITENYSVNNYTWGASVSFPLFLRKERGALKLNRAEIQELTAGLDFKVQEIEYKAQAAFNTWQVTYTQINQYDQNVANYLALLKGEQRLFGNGESSLFLINSREKSYINAQLKLIDAISNNQKAKIYVEYSLGTLFP